MMQDPAFAGLRALVIAVAVAGAGTDAIAAGGTPKDTPAQAETPFGGQAIPLGAPRPSVSVTPPADRNAFPADIMARMRAALVDGAGSFRVRTVDRQTQND